jgi:DNA-binding transcriptional LysR family regulator
MISSPDHPFAGRSNIPLESVMGEVFVTREEGSGTRSAIERHLAMHNLSFSQSFEMGSNEAIKHSVVAGLGLGLVSLHTIKMELEAEKLTILDVDGLPIMRDWHIVTRNGKRLSPAAKAFKKHILKEAAGYTESYHQVTPEIKA